MITREKFGVWGLGSGVTFWVWSLKFGVGDLFHAKPQTPNPKRHPRPQTPDPKLFASIIVCLLISITSFAQKNAIKAGVFIGSFNISYEHVFDKHSAIAIAPAYGNFTSSGIRYKIGGGGAEYRYYIPFLKKPAPRGFYAATGTGYYAGNASFTATNGSRIQSDISGFSVKLTGGFQHIFGKHFTIDVNGGTQYLLLKFKGGGVFINDEAFDGFVPYVGINFGYAF